MRLDRTSMVYLGFSDFLKGQPNLRDGTFVVCKASLEARTDEIPFCDRIRGAVRHFKMDYDASRLGYDDNRRPDIAVPITPLGFHCMDWTGIIPEADDLMLLLRMFFWQDHTLQMRRKEVIYGRCVNFAANMLAELHAMHEMVTMNPSLVCKKNYVRDLSDGTDIILEDPETGKLVKFAVKHPRKGGSMHDPKKQFKEQGKVVLWRRESAGTELHIVSDADIQEAVELLKE